MTTGAKTATKAPRTAKAASALAGPTRNTPDAPQPVKGFPGAPSGIVSFSTADTNPGARCVLAPAAGTTPEPDAYTAAIRSLWRDHMDARQHLVIFARALTPTAGRQPIAMVGPYHLEARQILEAIATRLRQHTTD